MFEWVIAYENVDVLEQIKKTGVIEFEPEFPELKFIIMKTHLKKETIMDIAGVISCDEPRSGYVDVQFD